MEGKSPDRDSPESGTRKSTISSGDKVHDTKEFLRKFVDSDSLKENLADWNGDVDEHDAVPSFDVPFELIDLQKFDYALEGIPFQQLIRMPNSIYASTSSAVEATAYLALEDFLHASVNGLWEAFWGLETDTDTMPFYVSSLYEGSLRFYEAEKAIAKGKLERLCATAIMVKNPRHPQGKWDDIVEVVLLRSGIGSVENDSKPPLSVMSEALFFAVRILVARSISRSNVPLSLNSVFILLVDSQYGGVIKVEGDLNKLEMDLNNVYESAATWIKNHSRISISRVDKIWNKLGNANWGDIGALQVLYATFQSISQYAGTPKNSVEDLAADHSSRLQTRRMERQLGVGDKSMDRNGAFRLQHRNASPEIVEVNEESLKLDNGNKPVKLELGSVILVEDSIRRNGYRIKEIVDDGEMTYYIASLVEDPGKALFLYIGSHPSHLEPAWEDMKYWYQVQRQAKVLSIMKQKGLSSKYLPETNASGRVVHSGLCRKPISCGNCDHPWCGTHVLLMSPVGATVADMVRAGQFGVDEAIKCCHDSLSALSASTSGGLRHGDIRPENIVCVKSGVGQDYFTVIGWGHAILEERDRPVLNLHYSSTSALQEGKLCPASDAESFVYMLYFCSGGDWPVLDSVEGALQWRETAWSRRVIQQTLGEISPVLKAFADYVDSLCGTPYPVDYEIWVRRLRRQFNEESGREVHTSS